LIIVQAGGLMPEKGGLTPQQYDTLLVELHLSCIGYSPSPLRRNAAAEDARQLSPSSIQLPPMVLVGGTGIGGVGADVTLFDWFDGTYSAGPSLPGPRESAAAAFVPSPSGGTVYVIGGDDGASVCNTVYAYSPPPITLLLSVPTPTATPTSMPEPTATSTPTPTATPLPTATPTATLVPLTVTLTVGSKKAKAGRKQTVTVTTAPGSEVAITAAFPGGRTMRHSGSADTGGSLTWRFKEPALPHGAKSHTVKIMVTVTDSAGRTATASAHYTGA
jgi:hypothetical protein